MNNCNNIYDKLLYLMETKKLIQQAIETQGVDVTNTTPYKEYAAKILEIRKVSSVNGKEGDVILTAADVNAYSKEEIDEMHWYGTKEEFDAIPIKNDKTIYHIFKEN